MERVQAQGDTRPMAGNRGNAEAMDDLRRILDSRASFYAKADTQFDTGGKSQATALAGLKKLLRGAVFD